MHIMFKSYFSLLGVSQNRGHLTWTQNSRSPHIRTPKQDPRFIETPYSKALSCTLTRTSEQVDGQPQYVAGKTEEVDGPAQAQHSVCIRNPRSVSRCRFCHTLPSDLVRSDVVGPTFHCFFKLGPFLGRPCNQSPAICWGSLLGAPDLRNLPFTDGSADRLWACDCSILKLTSCHPKRCAVLAWAASNPSTEIWSLLLGASIITHIMVLCS